MRSECCAGFDSPVSFSGLVSPGLNGDFCPYAESPFSDWGAICKLGIRQRVRPEGTLYPYGEHGFAPPLEIFLASLSLVKFLCGKISSYIPTQDVPLPHGTFWFSVTPDASSGQSLAQANTGIWDLIIIGALPVRGSVVFSASERSRTIFCTLKYLLDAYGNCLFQKSAGLNKCILAAFVHRAQVPQSSVNVKSNLIWSPFLG